MSFIEENFSPVGADARAGNAPQVFSYISEDARATIIADGYFSDMRNIVRRGDWLQITNDYDGTTGLSYQFIVGDGSTPSALSATVVDAGTLYSVGDLVEVTYTDITPVNKTILEVLTAPAGNVATLRVLDPGFFSVSPAALTPLPTIALTGTGDNALTVTITLAVEGAGVVTLSPLSMIATV